MVSVLLFRLFWLQIIQHDYFATFALDNHEIYRMIYPARGDIYFKDRRNAEEHPAAINRQYYNIYAVPKDIDNSLVSSTVATFASFFNFDNNAKQVLLGRLSNKSSSYASVQKKVSEEDLDFIKQKNLAGIYDVVQEYRYYPEHNAGSSILGFYGLDRDGNPSGLYGLEGYWQSILAGRSGFTQGARGADGSWISVAGRTTQAAEDGADIILTIDRALEYQACERLKKGMQEFSAKSAALVMMDPASGAILAMCSLPDFDPNEYNKTKDISAFNNQAIFIPYESGSVFKPITMAMGIDLDLINPNTIFNDPCERKIDGFIIHNALNKCYGRVSMINVLEESINTGMIWVEEKINADRFYEYLKKFGFGERTGIDLDTEAAGDISPLAKKGRIYGAVASFGQGFTTTPIQLAVAYAAFANGGQTLKPYVVDEIRYANGKIEKTDPKITGYPITLRTAKMISAMLVSVVENGHAQRTKFGEYYIAGKTGTAQIPGKGGYTEETIHTFAGFAPATDPQFVMVIKYEAPERQWAETTVVPVFKDIADFTLRYLAVKGDK